ncbi:MAG: hypothetical protein ACP5M9_04530 [Candidatus Micrarchaeia archaeon]
MLETNSRWLNSLSIYTSGAKKCFALINGFVYNEDYFEKDILIDINRKRIN